MEKYKQIFSANKDPVCGMTIDPKTTRFKSTYKGEVYYFCSEECKKDFDEDPEGFIEED